MTAERLCSGGYLDRICFTSFGYFSQDSSVNISEDNVNGSENGDQVSHQMSFHDLWQHS